jgi:hypothetical protein
MLLLSYQLYEIDFEARVCTSISSRAIQSTTRGLYPARRALLSGLRTRQINVLKIKQKNSSGFYLSACYRLPLWKKKNQN